MKKLLIFLVSLSCIDAIQACTVCGCSASNQYLGVLPNSKNSFAGVQYQYREFYSKPHSSAEGEEISHDNYHTVQLWGRYNLFNKVQLFAFVPYVLNERKESGVYSNNTGFGDITLLANYRILGAKCTGKKWQHNLLAGGGVKLPTGRYNSEAVRAYIELPNTQPGTASFDFIVNTNYTLLHNNTGLNTDVSYVITNPNKDKYKFGNRFSAGLLLFHTITANKFKIIPQLGSRYEMNSMDYSNSEYSIINESSGGNQLFASVGLQAFRNNIGGQFMFHKPIAQNYADGMVNSRYKTEMGIFILF